MQGGQEPGRGVYVVRRIVAVLVILLLLILFVPRACEAFIGLGEEPGPGAPETGETGDDAAGDKGETADEVATGDVESATETKDAAGGEGAEGEAEAPTDAETDEEEGGEVAVGDFAEVALDLGAAPVGLEAPLIGAPIGGVNQIPPQVPAIGVGNQQPALPGPPVIPLQGPVPLPQPVPLSGPAPLAAPAALPPGPTPLAAPLSLPPGSPSPFIQEPLFFEEPIFFEESIPLEEPLVFETQSAGDAAATPAISDSGGAVALPGTAVAGY
jgi:hypothetical protein